MFILVIDLLLGHQGKELLPLWPGWQWLLWWQNPVQAAFWGSAFWSWSFALGSKQLVVA
jgi:hypothetical protein